MKKIIEESYRLRITAVSLIFLIISSIFTVYLLNPVYASPPDDFKDYTYTDDFTAYQQGITGEQVNDIASGNNVCCTKTKQDSPYKGESCIYASVNNCDLSAGQPSGTTCEQTQECQPGVCIINGFCNANTLKGVCINQGGNFKTGTIENIQACQKGCCSLPTGSAFVTQAQCADAIKDYETLKLDEIFDASLNTEDACLAKSRSLETGCCVLPNACSYVTRNDCVTKGGDFKSNTLCSYPELGCRVTEKHHTGCFDNKVYWFDSANNPENIYGTNYATNGQRISSENSCGFSSSNAESLSCGNCDYSKGSICSDIPQDKIKDVNNPKLKYYCADLSCKNPAKSDINVFWSKDLSGRNERENGESWCEYEGSTGEGNDLVGSRHYRRICINGKEIIEALGEERSSICVQGILPKQETGLSYDISSALAQPNNANGCVQVNNQDGNCKLSSDELDQARSSGAECADLNGEDKFECGKKQLCRQKACSSSDLGQCYWNDAIKICNPAVPPGDNGLSGKNCKVFGENGKWTCKEFWYNGMFSTKYEKKSKSNCQDPNYINGMQNFCRSLGDCGFNYNVAGKEGDGFSATGPDDLLDGDVRPIKEAVNKLVKYQFNDKVEKPLNGSLYFALYNADLAFANLLNVNEPNSGSKAYKTLFTIAGIALFFPKIGLLFTGAFAHFLGFGATYTFGGGLSATAAGATGLGTAATIASIATIGLIAIGLLITFLSLFGTGSKTITYEFTCNSWTPPDGGADCEKCNSFTRCDEYKCKSLGASCTLLNKDFPGNETCVWDNKNDVNEVIRKPLVISPRTENDFNYPSNLGSFSGYEFKQQVDPFTDINVGIQTDKFAQCRIGNKPDLNFDQMQVFDDTRNKKEHKMTISAAFVPQPQPGSENAQIQINEDQILAYAGRDNIYYVKCKSTNGIVNIAPFFIKFKVKQGPDLQPPKIEGFSVKDNSFIPNNMNSTDISVYTNEPVLLQGGCRYSKSDKSYEMMESNSTCLQGRTANNQFVCIARLTGLENNKDNNYYFKCKDLSGNKNTESTRLMLKGTMPLKITSGTPTGLLYNESIDLKLDTADGAENGKAACFYSARENYDVSGIKFEHSDDVKHSTTMPLGSGGYTFYTWCRDLAGNYANKTLAFSVNTRISPTIIRVYTSSGTILNIKTDEQAVCRFKNDNKNFNFDEGVAFETTDNIIHSQVIGNNNVFHTICKHKLTGKISKVTSIYPEN